MTELSPPDFGASAVSGIQKNASRSTTRVLTDSRVEAHMNLRMSISHDVEVVPFHRVIFVRYHLYLLMVQPWEENIGMGPKSRQRHQIQWSSQIIGIKTLGESDESVGSDEVIQFLSAQTYIVNSSVCKDQSFCWKARDTGRPMP